MLFVTSHFLMQKVPFVLVRHRLQTWKKCEVFGTLSKFTKPKKILIQQNYPKKSLRIFLLLFLFLFFKDVRNLTHFSQVCIGSLFMILPYLKLIISCHFLDALICQTWWITSNTWKYCFHKLGGGGWIYFFINCIKASLWNKNNLSPSFQQAGPELWSRDQISSKLQPNIQTTQLKLNCSWVSCDYDFTPLPQLPGILPKFW